MGLSRLKPGGFSLVELIVAVGIIAILVAILIPVAVRIRAAARSTGCLANLHQWGEAYHMYLSANHASAMPYPYHSAHPGDVGYEAISRPLDWYETLAPYNGKNPASLLCPEARTPLPPDHIHWPVEGAAHYAWHFRDRHTFDGHIADFTGSYGINTKIYSQPVGNHLSDWVHSPTKSPNRVPVLGDCCEPYTNPYDSDGVPQNLQDPAPGHSGGVAEYCIDRHNKAVNVVFLDGHGEHVPLSELWTLRWSETFSPHAVVISAP